MKRKLEVAEIRDEPISVDLGTYGDGLIPTEIFWKNNVGSITYKVILSTSKDLRKTVEVIRSENIFTFHSGVGYDGYVSLVRFFFFNLYKCIDI